MSIYRHFLALFMLASLVGCGGGSGGVAANDPIATPAPTISLTSSAQTIDSGSSVTLTWTSTDATECSASGGWSGTLALSGSQESGAISADTQFGLSCTGPGGSTSASVAVVVTTTPTPTLTLSADPSSVSANGMSTLTWAATNIDTCDASGGWSGSRSAVGQETTGALAQTTTFTLSCSGPGGNISRAATVTVASSSGVGLSGTIDSSLIRVGASNKVYVFAGDVTPDDNDGDSGDAQFVIDVEQLPNACGFSYALASLPSNTYTVAFTNEAQNDADGVDDNINFFGAQTVDLTAGGQSAPFAAERIVRVGPGRTYSTIAAAVNMAVPGDVIEVDAGIYDDDVIVFRTNNIVVRGIGGFAHVRGTKTITFASGDDTRNGKGLWVVRSSNVRLEQIEFSGAAVTDENGAGVRNEGRDLTICKGYFHGNENGFLGGAYGQLTIEYSEFDDNGYGDIGRTHNIYVDDGSAVGDVLVFRHNNSHHANIGHTLKSRARENIIEYNRLMDEQSGTSSYNIDIPDGGLSFIVGNVIQQGPQTDNSAIIAYGAEGLQGGRTHNLYLVNNTIVNDRGSGVFVDINGSTSQFHSLNNLFVDSGTRFSGKSPTTSSGDIQTDSPGLVDRTNYDYRLSSGSVARDFADLPGSGDGRSLVPVYEYQSNAQRAERAVDATLDTGAHEYSN